MDNTFGSKFGGTRNDQNIGSGWEDPSAFVNMAKAKNWIMTKQVILSSNSSSSSSTSSSSDENNSLSSVAEPNTSYTTTNEYTSEPNYSTVS